MTSLCMQRNNFIEKIKFQEDKEKKKLLQIQKKLGNRVITLEIVSELTKDLTDEEKFNLLELYKTQINELETSLKNYKIRILKIRNK